MSRCTITQEEKLDFYKKITPIAIEERNKLFKDNKLNNEIEVLEQLGFIIVKFPSEDTDLSGFCINKSGNRCIYINTNTTKGRQNFSLWHEYYHLITNDGIGVSYKDGEKYSVSECRAHLFASTFLMPEEYIKKYLFINNITLPYIKNEEILEMSNRFNVSFSAMLYRITDIYPEYKRALGNRFSTANNYEKLKNVASPKDLSLEYEEVTNECYITKVFFEQIEKNYNDKKITDEKLLFIKELLEKAQKGNV